MYEIGSTFEIRTIYGISYASLKLCSHIVLPIISIILLYQIPKLKNHRKNITCGLAFLLVLHALSAYNAFIHFLPAGELDALSFWNAGKKAFKAGGIQPYVGWKSYVFLLYLQMKLTVMDLYVVQLFSICISVCNLLVMARIYSHLSTQNAPLWALILLLCLSPSFLLFSPLTMREPYELLSLLLFIYSSIKLGSVKGVFISCIFLIPAGYLHQALLLYSVIILSLFFCVIAANNLRRNSYAYSHLALGAIAAISLLVYTYSQVRIASGYTLQNLNDTGLFRHLQAYRGSIVNDVPNTAHNLVLSFNTGWETLYSLFINYIYYLFSPIINFKVSLEYFVMAWESVIRLIGIPCLLLALYNSFSLQKNRLAHCLLCLFYFSITFLWSMGTTNDGQAFRHHMLSQWVLLIYLAQYGYSKYSTNRTLLSNTLNSNS